MASDLSSSKDQLREVKELLLRLINPNSTPTLPQSNCAPVHMVSRDNSSPVQEPTDLLSCEPAVSSHAHPRIEDRHPVMPSQKSYGARLTSTQTPGLTRPVITCAGQALSPSCASGDTVPVTPNTLLQNFTNNMPIGAAVSTDISVSAETTSADASPHPIDKSIVRHEERMQDNPPPAPSRNMDIGATDGVTTRGMASTSDPSHCIVGNRGRLPLTLQPRDSNDSVAANTLCFILHPGHGNNIVAEGRTGGSWKSPSGKFGLLCQEGEQMVQIHKILIPGLRLIFIEERQPFTILDHALVKPSGSSVYVKWLTRLLWKRKKPQLLSKAT